MDRSDDGITRRTLLRGAGVAAIGVATAGTTTGCASLPRVGAGAGRHVCVHLYCRYYRAPAGGGGAGRCALPLREKGDSE